MTTQKLSLLNKREQQFVATVWNYYKQFGRHDLPWRHTSDPYHIVVSEVMLQQTQVVRVIPKYQAFLKRFKDTKTLAKAPLGDVLRAWQGLGYNRRAKFLHQAAQVVQQKYLGRWPSDFKELCSLPGIGAYTASAILVFSHNQPVPFIETNVRTVYLHHFFKNKTAITDTVLLALIEKTFSTERPCEWGWALMDYGAHLKAVHGNANTQSTTYKKQGAFKDSDRYIRGALLRSLLIAPRSRSQLTEELESVSTVRAIEQLASLEREGLVVQRRGRYSLP